MEGRSRRAPFIKPQGVFAEHPWAVIVGEPRKPLGQEAFSVGGTPGAERSRASLQPDKTVLRILCTQRLELLQRLVVHLLAVIDKDQGEARVLLIVAAICDRILDHPDAACLVSAEAGYVPLPDAAAAKGPKRYIDTCRR